MGEARGSTGPVSIAALLAWFVRMTKAAAVDRMNIDRNLDWLRCIVYLPPGRIRRIEFGAGMPNILKCVIKKRQFFLF
jgi:hypothetical protein